MPDRRQDLEATKQSIVRDTNRLKSLEETKATLDPADERMPELSNQVEDVASGLRDKAAAERQLAKEIEAAE